MGLSPYLASGYQLWMVSVCVCVWEGECVGITSQTGRWSRRTGELLGAENPHVRHQKCCVETGLLLIADKDACLGDRSSF